MPGGCTPLCVTPPWVQQLLARRVPPLRPVTVGDLRVLETAFQSQQASALTAEQSLPTAGSLLLPTHPSGPHPGAWAPFRAFPALLPAPHEVRPWGHRASQRPSPGSPANPRLGQLSTRAAQHRGNGWGNPLSSLTELPRFDEASLICLKMLRAHVGLLI